MRDHRGSDDGLETTPPINRIFRPSDLDVDDFAEAIRMLLGRDGEHANTSRSDLLSSAQGVSHVVETTTP